MALTVYSMIGVILYFIQELLLFHPKPLPQQYRFSFQQPFTELNIPVEKDRNLNFIQFTVADSVQKGVVLYFHGNRRNIERYAHYAPYFTSKGYEIWMVDYPGFGKSTGKRTEQVMYEDASLLYKMAAKQVPGHDIIIYGKSIGTGIAAQLASTQTCKQLILETPYYSIDALLRHYVPVYPVSQLTKYHFPVYKYLQQVKAPVTILHGTDDEVIPYKQAKRLKELHSQTELVTIRGGKHNNLLKYPAFRQKLDSLLTNK